MSELGIEPTYIGKNESLKFIVPFRMKLQFDDKIDRKISKKYSKYLQDTSNGFQDARKTKYENYILLHDPHHIS